MIRRPPRSTRTDTLFPYTTLFRSAVRISGGVAGNVIPDACEVEVNYRFAPSRDAEEATRVVRDVFAGRSEEHTSELQSLMRISYAVFCLKKKKIHTTLYNDVSRRLLLTHTHLSTSIMR